MERKHR